MTPLYTELLTELRDPTVRDLAWTLGSPGLLVAPSETPEAVLSDAFFEAALEGSRDWLRRLDAHPEVLHRYLSSSPIRQLGRYFERLIAFWLHHDTSAEAIQTNVQIRHDRLVVGELDFVLHHPQWGHVHWETAVKFYLQTASDWSAGSFLGPHARDRLDLKIKKLFDKQLPLGGQVEEARGNAVSSSAWVKGYLFYRGFEQPGPPGTPSGVSPRHLSGWWVRWGEDEMPCESGHFAILPRLRWLSPARIETPGSPPPLEFRAVKTVLADHFRQREEPVLLARVVEVHAGVWRECSRGFVVPPQWPHLRDPL